MENNEHDNNIGQAIKNLKRKELKQLLSDAEEEGFEDEISLVFINIERGRLKGLAAMEIEPKIPNPFFRYFKYAAAACILLVGGLWIYRINEVPSPEQISKIEPKKSIENIEKNNKIGNTIKEQFFYSKISIEDIGQMGFVINQFDFKNIVHYKYKKLEYYFNENKLVIHSQIKMKVKIYKIENKLYFKSNSKLYRLEETTVWKLPKEEFDKNILDLIP